MPLEAFADDIKFAADVTVHTRQEVQSNIDIVAEWAKSRNMPISVKKVQLCIVETISQITPTHSTVETC